ncbi:MAG: biopolymer transporter ExbD [bacterium]
MPGKNDRGRFSKPKSQQDLTITSLMDMMTIILVYLLKSFAAEGQILTSADNLVLPNSVSRSNPKEVGLQMAISTDWICIDNIPVIRTSEVRNLNEISIPKIKDKLEQCMSNEQTMVKIGEIASIKGEIVMQVDKNIDYDVLYKTMATCGEVGYNQMKFAVIGQEE